MMSKLYGVLILILMIPMSVHAQSEVEPSSNENSDVILEQSEGSDDYLLSEMELEEELWEMDSDPTYLELLWVDVDVLCDILLEFYLDLEVTDEYIYETFPDLWEPDYELYLFWEDDWWY
jgi:hypothetical protein